MYQLPLWLRICAVSMNEIQKQVLGLHLVDKYSFTRSTTSHITHCEWFLNVWSMNQSSGMKEKVQRIEVEKIKSPKSEQSLLYPNTAFNKINIRTSRTLIETLLWFCLFCACSGGISRLMPCSSSVKSHCKDCPLCIRKKKGKHVINQCAVGELKLCGCHTFNVWLIPNSSHNKYN